MNPKMNPWHASPDSGKRNFIGQQPTSVRKLVLMMIMISYAFLLTVGEIGRKTAAQILQAINKGNCTRDDLDMAKNRKPKE